MEGNGTSFEIHWASVHPMEDKSSEGTMLDQAGISADEGELSLYILHPYPVMDSIFSALAGKELKCAYDNWRLAVDRQEFKIDNTSEPTDKTATFLIPEEFKEFWEAFVAGSLLAVQLDRICDGEMNMLTIVYSLAWSKAAVDFVLNKEPVLPEEPIEKDEAPLPNLEEIEVYQATPNTPTKNTDLSGLDHDTKMSIQIACGGAQTEGPAPYRKCLERQLKSIEGMSDTPYLSGLDHDTKMSIQIACGGAQTEGPAPYRKCLERQLKSIEGMSDTPYLSGLDHDTKMSIQIACGGAQTEGPAPYRKCLEEKLRSIGM